MITENGVSTTTERGQFQCERFYSCFSRSWLVQWDYRDQAGKLHSGVSRSIEAAKKAAAKHGFKEAA